MKVVMEYYKELNKNVTFDFIYWVEDESDYSNQINSLGGRTYKIDKPSIRNYFKFQNKIKNLMHEYDAIHIHEMYLIRLVQSFLKNSNCKIIGHAHTTEYSDKFFGKLRNKLLCINVKDKVNLMLACSLDAGKNYFGNEFKKEGQVIPNAFNVEKFLLDEDIRKNYRKKFGIKSNEKVLFHVGRFNNQKNHLKIIEIFSELIKFENTKLVLVGIGPTKKLVQEKIVNMGIQNRVLFLNPRDDINNLMMMSDVFIFPSLYEGLGIAFVEAQYTGIITIVSDVIPEEAFITNDVVKMNLSTESSEWAKKIKLQLMEKKSRTVVIKSEIYNIKKSKNILLKAYEGLIYEK
ncbi:MAG: glycosyltransferase [Vagococcus sp.]|jgi:glycosyltransferase involved in cell wall biosynthesis|nr:glycosyltransferase [Vagococcus sp.]